MNRFSTTLLLALLIWTLPARAAEDLDAQIQEFSEEIEGETDHAKWAEPELAYRRRITIVTRPGVSKPKFAIIDGLSLRKLMEEGKVGSGVVARVGSGNRLDVYTDAAQDALIVQLPPEKQERSDLVLALYYGDVKPFAMPPPPPNAEDLGKGTYHCYHATEESKDPDKSLDLVTPAMMRYASLVMVEPVEKMYPNGTPALEGAHFANAARFADNKGTVETQPFPIASEGKHLLRARWHSQWPANGEAKVVLTSADGTQTHEVTLALKGEGFFESETVVELKPGSWKATVSAPEAMKKLGLDFLTLTPDLDWHPSYREITGPLWIRFRIPADDTKPVEAIDLVATHTTYTEIGMLSEPDGEYHANAHFSGVGMRDLFPQRRLTNQLKPGSWTPWGELRNHGSWTWFETLTLRAPALHQFVEMQFAFEPYESNVFHQSKAECAANQVSWRMPTRPDDFAQAIKVTRTFEEGILDRTNMSKQLGITGEHKPKKIGFTIFHQGSPIERLEEMQLEMFGRMGFNGVNQPQEKYAAIYQTRGYDLHQDYARINEFAITDWSALLGSNYADSMKNHAAMVDRTLNKDLRVGGWLPKLAKFNDLGDEIGPAIAMGSLTKDKALYELFVLWAKDQKLEPSQFDLKSWDDARWGPALLGKAEWRVETQEYFNRQATDAARMREQPGAELFLSEEEQTAAEKQAKEDEIRAASRKGRELLIGEKVEKERLAKEPIIPDPKSPAGKRMRFWFKKFQADFTARFYHAHGDAVNRQTPTHPVSSPNFQAAPAQHGNMWLGEIDLFTWGRFAKPGAAMMQIEDWVGNAGIPHCAFAGALLRATCRPTNSVPACLVTGGRARPKNFAWMSQGVHKLNCYLYGPIYNIGPVWAEDPPSYTNLASSMSDAGRFEDDILACKPKNDVAMLVSISTEIVEMVGRDHGRPRQWTFGELGRAGIGADVIGEDDILLDKLHERYKLLVVVDPAVQRSVQDVIAKWAAAGNSVFLSKDAAKFDEYEEPTDALASLRQDIAVTAPEPGNDTLRDSLLAAAKKAGIKPQISHDGKDVWAWSTVGEKTQILWIFKLAPGDPDVKISLPRDSKPREIISARNGPLDATVTDGQLTFTLHPPTAEQMKEADYPYADIVAIRD